MCGPEDPLFMPLLPLARVPFQAKESVHKTSFWENLEILASTASISPKFQITSPKIWKFSAHKPPNLEILCSQAPLFRGKCQFASPTLRKSGPHTTTWKKVECPPEFMNHWKRHTSEALMSALLAFLYTSNIQTFTYSFTVKFSPFAFCKVSAASS